MTKIGLSLCLCVKDFIRGNVDFEPEDVKWLVNGTACETDEDWEDVIRTYRNTYWREDPDRGEAIARQWLAEGKIRQPRLDKRPAPLLTGGWWKEV